MLVWMYIRSEGKQEEEYSGKGKQRSDLSRYTCPLNRMCMNMKNKCTKA